MNTKELRNQLGSELFGSDEDAVRIRLDQPSVGPVATAGIDVAYAGFDWEDGLFILQPDAPLVSWDYLEKYHPGIRDEIEADRARYAKRPLRCIVAGSRGFGEKPEQRALMERFIHHLACPPYVTADRIEVVSGGARGTDTVGAEIARELGYSVKEFPADWKAHGKVAGHIRNRRMAEYAAEDAFLYRGELLAFWDGQSKGTKNMIDTAEKMGLTVRVIDVSGKM